VDLNRAAGGDDDKHGAVADAMNEGGAIGLAGALLGR
jgi:hypothetical protein